MVQGEAEIVEEAEIVPGSEEPNSGYVTCSEESNMDEPEPPFPVEEEQLLNPEIKPERKCKPGKRVLDPNLPVDPPLMKPGKIDDKGMFTRLYIAGLTHEEIASYFGVSREAVSKMVARMDLVRETTNPSLFQQRMEEEILIRMESIMRYMTPDKMTKASLSQLVMALGILYDKLRLQRGESTHNVANLNIHAFGEEDLSKIRDIIQKRTQDKLKKTKKTYGEED